MRGFLRGWHEDPAAKVVVDKNRAWLHAIELLLHIEPDAKLLVCLRDLGQIYGSIEAQHQRTILVDFIDHLADFDRFGRADMLFAKDRTIGAPLISLHAVPDLPSNVQKCLYFVRFEDLMANPEACMTRVHEWLGVAARKVDVEKLALTVQESDSHYRMKYPHSSFAKWNLNLARQQQFTAADGLYLSFAGQWTSDNLDSSQKMVAGGPYTVRAYDLGVLSGDTGELGTAELQHTLGDKWGGSFQASAYFDSEHIVINHRPWAAGVNSATLSGAGLGLAWNGPHQWSAKLQIAERVGGVPTLVHDPASVRVWAELNRAF